MPNTTRSSYQVQHIGHLNEEACESGIFSEKKDIKWFSFGDFKNNGCDLTNILKCIQETKYDTELMETIKKLLEEVPEIATDIRYFNNTSDKNLLIIM